MTGATGPLTKAIGRNKPNPPLETGRQHPGSPGAQVRYSRSKLKFLRRAAPRPHHWARFRLCHSPLGAAVSGPIGALLPPQHCLPCAPTCTRKPGPARPHAHLPALWTVCTRRSQPVLVGGASGQNRAAPARTRRGTAQTPSGLLRGLGHRSANRTALPSLPPATAAFASFRHGQGAEAPSWKGSPPTALRQGARPRGYGWAPPTRGRRAQGADSSPNASQRIASSTGVRPVSGQLRSARWNPAGVTGTGRPSSWAFPRTKSTRDHLPCGVPAVTDRSMSPPVLKPCPHHDGIWR